MRNCLNRRCDTKIEEPGFCKPCQDVREETLRKAKKAYMNEGSNGLRVGSIRNHRFALPHCTR
jgi:hypothetical protein